MIRKFKITRIFAFLNHITMKKILFVFSLTLLLVNGHAQRFFEVDDIRYRVILEADEAHTYGTVSVARPEFGE